MEFLTPSPGLSNVGMNTSENYILQNFQVNKLYPNPFNSTINIDINHSQTMNNVLLDIISINGRSIYSSSIDLHGIGQSTISVELNSQIASGCYLLRVGKFEHFTTRKDFISKINSMYKTFLVILVSSLCLGADFKIYSYDIIKLDGEIVIDGILNESTWSIGQPITKLIQKDPHPRALSREISRSG